MKYVIVPWFKGLNPRMIDDKGTQPIYEEMYKLKSDSLSIL